MRISGNIQWAKVADAWELSFGEEVLISLGTNQKGIHPLFLEELSFQLIEKGRWWPVWQILNKKGEEILHMNYRMWSSKGKICFKDGQRYECVFKNMPSMQIIIRDLRYGEEMISYQLEKQSDGRVVPRMKLHQREVATDKLLFLLALGMALFLKHHEEEFDLTTFLLLCTS